MGYVLPSSALFTADPLPLQKHLIYTLVGERGWESSVNLFLYYVYDRAFMKSFLTFQKKKQFGLIYGMHDKLKFQLVLKLFGERHLLQRQNVALNALALMTSGQNSLALMTLLITSTTLTLIVQAAMLLSFISSGYQLCLTPLGLNQLLVSTTRGQHGSRICVSNFIQ